MKVSMIFNYLFSKVSKKRFVVMLGTLSVFYNVNAQVSISGPQCIIPGNPYQYIIAGKWVSDSWMKLCVRGGKLEGGQQCSVSGKIINTFFITWSDSSYHGLELISSLGNVKLELKSTSELKGGEINQSDKIRICESGVTNYTFRCAPAKGGSCEPKYSYQWQRSENGLNWTIISSADKKDLKFTGTVKVNTYFRRVTTESGSNMIAYSDHALLAVTFK
jgi:hypothetical protein